MEQLRTLGSIRSLDTGYAYEVIVVDADIELCANSLTEMIGDAERSDRRFRRATVGRYSSRRPVVGSPRTT
ncbi:hypothetical protein [Natrialbaceae archaeon AArc-T1-2]|uniref:hypothetical protein n=1 Tax=Natrialbaceae archaeon AArc-T1-2 TaxID=3053904 RepID=UPI00255A930C|nr:hypothetical protein [Natrialbaceae archaeon AArc-T1-2]WIV66709.1 hypothetical protein QQ977_13560 [Natrialbaceae archaeon AArc-T1-2]